MPRNRNWNRGRVSRHQSGLFRRLRTEDRFPTEIRSQDVHHAESQRRLDVVLVILLLILPGNHVTLGGPNSMMVMVMMMVMAAYPQPNSIRGIHGDESHAHLPGVRNRVAVARAEPLAVTVG